MIFFNHKTFIFINLTLRKMEKQVAAIQSDGINFMIDNEGNRVAVVINLEKYGDLLEDFFDIVISRRRIADDEKVSLSDFKQALIDEERLATDV